LVWLDALLQREGVEDAYGGVWLHTYPRVLGYTFKPVSSGTATATGALRAIVVEVNNTFTAGGTCWTRRATTATTIIRCSMFRLCALQVDLPISLFWTPGWRHKKPSPRGL
jgi:hypothetical protein